MGFKTLLLQEKSSFAKECKKKGGFFKCCIIAFTLNIFETSRNSLIKEGLIKDKPTSWCKPGWGRKDPCMICTTDAMCTTLDVLSGQPKHTFYKGYKNEHRVMSLSGPLIFSFIGWGTATIFWLPFRHQIFLVQCW